MSHPDTSPDLRELPDSLSLDVRAQQQAASMRYVLATLVAFRADTAMQWDCLSQNIDTLQAASDEMHRYDQVGLAICGISEDVGAWARELARLMLLADENRNKPIGAARAFGHKDPRRFGSKA
jgi:hypothetical protein